MRHGIGYQLRIVAALCLLSLTLPQIVSAHFKLNLNIRVIHVEHVADGLDVYLRLPMPYLVASLLGPEKADGTRDPAPFTTNATVDGELMHYVDNVAFETDPLALGQLAADGHIITSAGSVLTSSVAEVRLASGDTQLPFSTLDEAKKVFQKPPVPLDDPPWFVGDTVVDVHLRYIAERAGSPVKKYSIHSVLNPELPGQKDTANLILDYYGDEQRIFRVTGLLLEPQQISRSEWKAAITFVREGISHILTGYDHLLYVACLVIGAVTLAGLAWRITGFTIGHSITLSLGYFGFVPSSAWFIPAVETGIALSIIYAAVMALSESGRTRQERSSFFVTSAIGLLHGLGFSFMLREILGLSSANVWVSLLSFNVGVELGQLAVVIVLWPLLWWLGKFNGRMHQFAKWAIAVPAIGLASIWTGERVVALMSSL